MTLAELIKRDSITAHWFWTHEVSTGPYTEHEVWDVVFVRDTHEPQRWVTDGDTRRTAYLQGYHGAHADSRRATGGERREPDTVEALSNLLADAAQVDEHPTLRDWIQESFASGNYDPACIDAYESAVRIHKALRAWLGDQYDEYVNADRD